MSSKIRYVSDTNVIVSSLLFVGVASLKENRSKPAQAFNYALNHGEILLSSELLAELSDVLGRKKFDRFLTSEERDEFLETFIDRASNLQKLSNLDEVQNVS